MSTRESVRLFKRRDWATDDPDCTDIVEKLNGLDATILELTYDLAADAGTVAGNMGLIAELEGDYEERLINADAEYRSWREDFKRKMFDPEIGDPKLPEWKVKQAYEADLHFVWHKRKIAGLEGDLAHLRRFGMALAMKGRMVEALSGKTALIERAERGIDARPGTNGRSVLVPRKPLNVGRVEDIDHEEQVSD